MYWKRQIPIINDYDPHRTADMLLLDEDAAPDAFRSMDDVPDGYNVMISNGWQPTRFFVLAPGHEPCYVCDTDGHDEDGFACYYCGGDGWVRVPVFECDFEPELRLDLLYSDVLPRKPYTMELQPDGQWVEVILF